ncbi:hypothetical protein, partial [uncultured Selenomonas sp.]|uniref:hypothetical protein n=1 Tax=uncultured Selenomonas sp. TaxID=159275 RepID=UPI0026773CBD
TEPFTKWNFLRQFILQLTGCYREVRPEHCIQFIIVSALAITTTIYYNHATINNVETHNITDFQKFFLKIERKKAGKFFSCIEYLPMKQ